MTKRTYGNTTIPKILEKIYPLSIKEENSLFVNGRNKIPIPNTTSQNLTISPKSKKYIFINT